MKPKVSKKVLTDFSNEKFLKQLMLWTQQARKKKSITLFTALISSKLKFYHKWKIKIMENTVVSNTLTEKMII